MLRTPCGFAQGETYEGLKRRITICADSVMLPVLSSMSGCKNSILISMRVEILFSSEGRASLAPNLELSSCSKFQIRISMWSYLHRTLRPNQDWDFPYWNYLSGGGILLWQKSVFEMLDVTKDNNLESLYKCQIWAITKKNKVWVAYIMLCTNENALQLIMYFYGSAGTSSINFFYSSVMFMPYMYSKSLKTSWSTCVQVEIHTLIVWQNLNSRKKESRREEVLVWKEENPILSLEYENMQMEDEKIALQFGKVSQKMYKSMKSLLPGWNFQWLQVLPLPYSHLPRLLNLFLPQKLQQFLRPIWMQGYKREGQFWQIL